MLSVNVVSFVLLSGVTEIRPLYSLWMCDRCEVVLKTTES